ncbi:type VII secretion protein [Bacillus cereus]|uniref:WXG100 family type VII secretion target n=1 Tax=Bacillus paramycoides TaxID=2026194 RepID=UPI000BF27563|nr:WXG100 family type VII secretion target [Bacillus paramycoides]PFD46280.1 type VII secretion protein [Bacillus cereus]PGM47500.1 type VII secretion protein [Bacillus cereus]
MVLIKVTPEMLEQAAKTVSNTRHFLEYLHNDLYNQIENIASQWNGASREQFYQRFNEAKPKMFTVLMELDKVFDELMRAAKKFRNTDESYEDNSTNKDLTYENTSESGDSGNILDNIADAWDGLYSGAGEAVGDAVEGFKSLGDGETWSNMWDAVVNYDETLPAMWNAFSDSFMNDVWNGDVESGFHWGSYFLTSITTGFIGGKGLDKVSKLARGVNVYKVTEAFPPRLQPAFAGGGLTGEGILSTLPPSGHWGNYLSGYLMFARPSWRQSELDVGKENPNYREQVIFKDGEELEKKTKGSSIPDLYSEGAKHAIEVKNYDVSTSAKRTRLAYVIGKQVEARLKNLPEGTTQSIVVDIRGQEIGAKEILELKKKILDKTNNQATVEIKKQ